MPPRTLVEGANGCKSFMQSPKECVRPFAYPTQYEKDTPRYKGCLFVYFYILQYNTLCRYVSV